MVASNDRRNDIIDSALRLAADRGWHRLSQKDIAEAVRLSLGELRAEFPCKASILVAYAQRVEVRAVAEPVTFDEADTVRDRLFELLMQRLDVLAGDRPAVVAILRDVLCDPLTGLAVAPEVLRMMAPILEAAGVSAAGPVGLLRCKGLAAVWLSGLAVWAGDDSPDSAKTMAALDRALRRIEPIARIFARLDGGRPSGVSPGGF